MKFFISFKTNEYIKEEDALVYALNSCGYRQAEESELYSDDDRMEFILNFGKEIVDWFFSGDWITIDAENEEEASKLFLEKTGVKMGGQMR